MLLVRSQQREIVPATAVSPQKPEEHPIRTLSPSRTPLLPRHSVAEEDSALQPFLTSPQALL